MNKFVSIGVAAKALGVSCATLRRWEQNGRIKAKRTLGQQRRYDLEKIAPFAKIGGSKRSSRTPKKTIAYARVSSSEQKQDLERQKQVLEFYCAQHGWKFEIISDLGSGMNYAKKGLKRLIKEILEEKVVRIVLTHKDRLLRFGAELIFAICEEKQVEVVILNQSKEPRFEEELAKDVIEIISVFSARLYGARSRKNQKLISGIKESLSL